MDSKMLLTEFFNTPEGDSYANSASTSQLAESKGKISASEDPCWKGYHMVGTKTKGGREVPNCVPGEKGAMTEGAELSHIIQARQLVRQALRDSDQRQEYFDFLKHLRSKYGKEYSTRVHQDATKLDAVKEGTDGIDTVSVDVPLLIRLLEYAREDAQTDMDLHHVADRMIELSQEDRTLTMDDYQTICGSKE